MMFGLLSLVAAYLIGGVPFGFLVVRLMTGKDVRAEGSGNIGATNVLRTTGKLPGILTLVLDIAKGVLAVWMTDRLTGGDPVWLGAAAVAVVLGHAFPVFLKFQGGKAVASFVGAFGYLAPLPLAAVVIVFVVVVAVTRFVSLGSIIGAMMFPLALWLIAQPPAAIMGAAMFGGVFIIWRHEGNIARLRAGNENVLSFSKKTR